jgi:multisubunit Na+/H+ antiporter MnhG subunit
MSGNVGVLIFFAILGAAICARARVAGGAIVFAVIAVALFVTTPLGAGLPAALASFVDTLSDSTTPILDGSTGRAVG